MVQLNGKNKIRLAFIGQHGLFSGNCKYLFLSSIEDKRFESTYVTDRQNIYDELERHGLPIVTMDQAIVSAWSFADILVLDDGVPENIKATFGSRPLVQLWHGIGPKMAGLAQIEAGTIELPDWHKLLIKTIYTGYDLVCATSQLCEILYRNYFSAPAFPITGMCRNDVLFRAADTHDLIGAADVDGLDGSFNVMIAMTFRESGSILKSILDDELADLFRLHKINLIVKPHPYEEIPSDLRSKCTVIDPESDIYPVLHRIDVMITDFSSLASDFILLDRPVIHWTPDREDYVTTCRDMSYDPNIFRLGFWAKNKDELLEEIVKIRSGVDDFRDQRKIICSLLHEFKDGSSCKRTLTTINARYSALEKTGLEPTEARWQKRRSDRDESKAGASMAELDECRGKANHQLCIAAQNSDYETVRANVKIINDIERIEACVIGDSHVWGYAVPHILPIWLGAKTMHRFGRDKGAMIRPNELGLDPDKTKLIFNFGEIDARSHVGEQAKRQNKPELEICESLVHRYIMAIQSITRGWPPEAIWIATTVPPHEIPENSPHAYVNAPPVRERIQTFRTLNACLARTVARSSFKLLDAYSLLSTPDGTLPDHLTNDDIHIYTDSGRALLRSYCEKEIEPSVVKDWHTAQRLTILGKPAAVAYMFESERRGRGLSPDEDHYLGRALLDLGETDEAISLLERVRHSCSEPPWAALYLCRAYREKGRILEAAQLLSEIFAYQDLNDYFKERLSDEIRLTESMIAE